MINVRLNNQLLDSSAVAQNLRCDFLGQDKRDNFKFCMMVAQIKITSSCLFNNYYITVKSPRCQKIETEVCICQSWLSRIFLFVCLSLFLLLLRVYRLCVWIIDWVQASVKVSKLQQHFFKKHRQIRGQAILLSWDKYLLPKRSTSLIVLLRWWLHAIWFFTNRIRPLFTKCEMYNTLTIRFTISDVYSHWLLGIQMDPVEES